MQIVIDIPEQIYLNAKTDMLCGTDVIVNAIKNGTPLPKGHGFIAICDSDFPITEEVKQKLKNTTFVGDEDCEYFFDMMEIIEADKAEREERNDTNSTADL